MAWSVAGTSFIEARTFLHLQYPVVLVNAGGAWNPSSHKAVIPRDGYYFIHVGGAVPAAVGSFLDFRVNNKRTFITMHSSNNHNGTDTMSRSGIFKLSVGDELTVYAYRSLYSDNQMQIIFIGILL